MKSWKSPTSDMFLFFLMGSNRSPSIQTRSSLFSEYPEKLYFEGPICTLLGKTASAPLTDWLWSNYLWNLHCPHLHHLHQLVRQQVVVWWKRIFILPMVIIISELSRLSESHFLEKERTNETLALKITVSRDLKKKKTYGWLNHSCYFWNSFCFDDAIKLMRNIPCIPVIRIHWKISTLFTNWNKIERDLFTVKGGYEPLNQPSQYREMCKETSTCNDMILNHRIRHIVLGWIISPNWHGFMNNLIFTTNKIIFYDSLHIEDVGSHWRNNEKIN